MHKFDMHNSSQTWLMVWCSS